MIVKHILIFILISGGSGYGRTSTVVINEHGSLTQCQYTFDTLKKQTKGLIDPIILGGCFEK